MQSYPELVGMKNIDDNGLVSRAGDPTPASYLVRLRNSSPTALTGSQLGDQIDVRGVANPNEELIYRDHTEDMNDRLHDHQGFWGRMGNAGIRLVGTTLTKTGQGFAYLGGLGAQLFDSNTYTNEDGDQGNVLTRAADNIVVDAFKKAEEAIKASSPIYERGGFDQLSVPQKLMTSEFWANQGVDGVAFMLSSLAPAALAAKLQAGTRLAMGAGKVANRAKALDVVKKLTQIKAGRYVPNVSPALKTWASGLDHTTAFLLQSSVEAMFESDSVYDTIMKDETLKIPEDQKKKLAAQKARDTYAFNMMALAPSNYIETKAVFSALKGFKKGSQASRNSRGIDFTASAASKPQWYKNPVARSVIGSAVAEGLYEENIQYSIEQLATNKKYSDLTGLDAMMKLVSEQTNPNSKLSLLNLSDPHRQESIALGSILGGGVTLASNAAGGGERGRINQEKQVQEAFREAYSGLQGSFDGLADVFEKKPSVPVKIRQENGKYYKQVAEDTELEIDEATYQGMVDNYADQGISFDEGGEFVQQGEVKLDDDLNPIVDPNKLKAKMDYLIENKKLEQLVEQLEKSPQNNATLYRYAKKAQLANLANLYFKAGKAEEFYDRLNSLADITDNELIAFGIDPTTAEQSKREDLKSAQELVRGLENIYNTVEDTMISLNKDAALNEQRKDYVRRKATTALIADSLVADLELQQQKDDLTRLSSLNTDLFQGLSRQENEQSETTMSETDLKIEQLLNTRDQALEEVSKVADFSRGLSYYEKNQKELEEYNPLATKLNITDSTTAEDYTKYQADTLANYKLRDRFLRSAQKAAITGIINQSNFSQPFSIYQELVLNNIPITQEVADSLAEAIYTEFRAIENSNEVVEALVSEVDKAQEDFNKAFPEDKKEAENELKISQDRLKQAQELNEQIRAELDPDNNYPGIQAVTDNLNRLAEPLLELTDDQYKAGILESQLNYTNLIMANYENNPNYADTAAIEAQLKLVKQLEKILNTEALKEDIKAFEARIKGKKIRGYEALQALSEYLDEIHFEVSKRKHNRIAQDRAFYINNLNNNLSLAGLKLEDDLTVSEIDTQASSMIKGFIGEAKYNEIVKNYIDSLPTETANSDLDLSQMYLYHNVVSDILLSELTDDQATEINNLVVQSHTTVLERIQDSPLVQAKINDFTSVIYDRIFNELESLTSNVGIYKLVKSIVPEANKLGLTLDPDQATDEFIRDANITKYASLIEGYTGELDKMSLVQLVQDLAELNNLKELTFRTQNYKANKAIVSRQLQLAREAKSAHDNGIKGLNAPSFQQWNAINKLAAFLASPAKKVEDNSELFSEFAYLKGLASTGKTSTVVKWAIKSLGLNSSDLILSAPTPNTLLPLTESIQGNHTAVFSDLQELLNNGLTNERPRLLVLDEVGKLTRAQVVELATMVRTYNMNNQDAPLKVIVLGDPNQLNENASIQGIESFGDTDALQGLKNYTTLESLTIRYRSDVPVINDIQDTYLTSFDLDINLQGAINVPTSEINRTDKELKGVYIEDSSSKLVSTLINSVSNYPDKSRLIIVNSKDDVAKYEKMIPGELLNEKLQILSVRDTQGFTVDEVYMDLNYPNLAYSDKYQYNNARYVASSRAVSFVFIKDSTGENSFVDNMEELTAEVAKTKTSNMEFIVDYLTLLNNQYQGINTNIPTTPVTEEQAQTEEPSNPITSEVEEITVEDINDSGVQDTEETQIPSSPITEEQREAVRELQLNNKLLPLTFPTQSSFFKLQDYGAELDAGVEAKLGQGQDIPVSILVDKARDLAHVVMPADTENTFRQIGVLSREEIQNLGIPYESLNHNVTNTNGLLSSDGQLLIGKLSPSSRKLQYKFADELASMNSFEHGGEKGFAAIFNKWAADLFGDAQALENYEQAKDSLRVAIFKQADVDQWLQMYPNTEIVPKKGVPYLIIQNWIAPNSKNPGKPQLIQMTPRKLNNQTDSDLLAPITRFINDIKSIEALFDKHKKDTSQESFKLGATNSDGQLSSAGRRFPRVIGRLSDFHAGKYNDKDDNYNPSNLRSAQVKKDIKMIETYFGVNSLTEIPADIIDLAVDIDFSVHGLRTGNERRSGKGVAQQAMDRIAASNFIVNGKILRQGYINPSSNTPYTKGKSLLGPMTLKSDGKIHQFTLSNIVRDQLNSYVKKRIDRNPNSTDEMYTEFFTRTLESNNRQTTFSTSTLEDLFVNDFDSNGDHAGNDGFGLRYPIVLEEDNYSAEIGSNKGRIPNGSASNLETKFTGVKGASINIELNDNFFNNTSSGNPSSKEQESDLKNDNGESFDIGSIKLLEKSRVGSIPQQTLSRDQLEKLAEEVLPESFIDVVRNYFGLKRSNGERELFRIIKSAQAAKLAGKDVYGLYKNGMIYLEDIDNGKANAIVLRHEMFHKVFNEYLTPEEQERALRYAQHASEGLLNSKEDLEEYLADRFMEYQAQPRTFTRFIRAIFKKLARMIKLHNLYSTSIDSLFEDIYLGVYSSPVNKEVRVTRAASKITEDFGNTKVYIDAKKVLLSLMEHYNSLNSVSLLEENYLSVYRHIRAAKKQFNERVLGGETLNQNDEGLYDAMLALSNKKAFMDMVNSIFPTTSISSLREMLQQAGLSNEDTDAYNFTDLESIGLTSEVQDAELVDERASLSSAVKTQLTTIRNTDGDFVSFQQAYIIAINAFNKVRTQSFSDLLEDVNTNLTKAKHVTHKNGKAVKTFLDNLIADVRDYKGGFFEFVDYDTFSTTNPISGQSETINRLQGQSTVEFFEDIVRFTDMSLDQVKGSFRNFKKVNFLNSMISNLGSLREKQPFVGVRSGGGNNRKVRYISNRESGAIQTHMLNTEAGLKRQLIAQGKDYAKQFDDYKGKTISQIRALPPTERNAKVELIVDFLKFNHNKNVQSADLALTNADINTILEDIENLIRRFRTEAAKFGTQRDNKFLKKIDTIVRDQSSFLGNITDALSNADQQLSAANFIRGDGKVQYKYIKSSFAYNTLEDMAADKKPEFMSSEMYKHNGYNNGLQIYDVIDHDSMKVEGFDNALRYKYETPSKWLERTFLYMFFGGVDRFKGQGKFFLPTYSISNKPNITGLLVNLIKDKKDIDKHLKLIIENQINRPDLDIQGYSENKRKFQLPGVYGVKITEDTKVSDIFPLVKEALAKEKALIAEKLFDTNEIVLPSDYAKKMSNFGIKLQTKHKKKEKGKEYTEQEIQQMKEDNKKHYREVYAKLADVFVDNFFIHSFNSAQMIAGDVAFFKRGDSMDTIKRMSLFFANGIAPTVNSKIGMNPTYNQAIASDLKAEVTEELMKLNKKLQGKEYDATDAQGFITPQAAQQLSKAIGVEFNNQSVLKPVYAGIDKNGIPRTTKYSLIVLTDELVAKEEFEGLRQIRTVMENSKGQNGQPIDQLVFKTATKTGIPKNLTQLNSVGGIDSILEDSVVELESKNLRLQFNPYHDFMHTLSTNPGQFTYFPGAYQETIQEAQQIHKLNSEIIGEQSTMLSKELSLDNSGRSTPETFERLRRMQERSAAKNNNSRLTNLLAYKKEGRYAISDNLPLITEKVIQTASSIFTNGSVQFKFPGGKFNIQSEVGTYTAENLRLEYKDKDGYTEVYLPDIYQDVLKAGDVISNKTAFAYRLPTSGLHLGIALRIKGFYPSTNNQNIIIAPSAIVEISGADYDIDALYVLRRSTERDFLHSIERIDQAKLKAGLTEMGYSKEVLEALGIDVPTKGIVGYGQNLKKRKNFKDLVKRELDKVRDELQLAYSEMSINIDTIDRRMKEANVNNLLEVEKYFSELYITAAKNDLVDTYIGMLTNQQYNHLSLEQVSMDRLSNEIIPGLQTLTKKGNEVVDNNLPSNQQKAHYEIFSGDSLMGIIANSIKTFSYLTSSIQPVQDEEGNLSRGPVKLKENLAFELDGHSWDTFQDYEKVLENGELKNRKVGTSRVSIMQTMDGLLNAAIDNVKELIAGKINLNTFTSNQYLTLVKLGIPLETVTYFMNHPTLVTAAQENKPEVFLSRRLRDLDGTEVIPLTTQNLKEALDPNKEVNEGVEKSVLLEFKKLSKIKEDLRVTSDYLNILKDLPNTRERLEKLMRAEKRLFEISPDILKKALSKQVAKDLASELSGKTITQRMAIFAKYYKDNKKQVDEKLKEMGEDPSNLLDYTVPTKYSFNTSVIFNPHIYEAHLALNKLNRFQESHFTIFNPKVTEKLNALIKKGGFKSYRQENMMKDARESLMHYLLTSLSIPVNEIEQIDMDIDLDTSVTFKGKVYKGIDAWMHKFAESINSEHRNNPNYSGNVFVKGLAVQSTRQTGLSQIVFTNDKISSTEDVEIFANAFNDIGNQQPEFFEDGTQKPYNSFQKDLIKYSILAHGLKFGRVSYANSLPESFLGIIDESLAVRIEQTLNEDLIDNIEDDFMVQFIVNNPIYLDRFNNREFVNSEDGRWRGFAEGVHYAVRLDPSEEAVESTSQAEQWGEELSGIEGQVESVVEQENVNENEITDNAFNKKFPLFARINNMIVKRVSTADDINLGNHSHVYYMRVTDPYSNKNYSFDNRLLVDKYDLDKAFFAGAVSESDEYLQGGTLKVSNGTNLNLQENDVVHLYNKANISRTRVGVYKVNKVIAEERDGQMRYRYAVSPINIKENFSSLTTDSNEIVDSPEVQAVKNSKDQQNNKCQ